MKNRDVARAFAEHRAAKAGNARTDGQTYWLYGNPIAQRHDASGTVHLDWCGHFTVTTRAHMNLLLDELGATYFTVTARAHMNLLLDALGSTYRASLSGGPPEYPKFTIVIKPMEPIDV